MRDLWHNLIQGQQGAPMLHSRGWWLKSAQPAVSGHDECFWNLKYCCWNVLSYLKLCLEYIPDALPPLALIQALQCSPDWCCAISIWIALHSREPHKQCCFSALNTKPFISLLPSFPVKRAREDHEAQGSGTEPQKKRQKEERKTEQDGSSPSANIHRLKTTPTLICQTKELCCLTATKMHMHPPKATTNSIHTTT